MDSETGNGPENAIRLGSAPEAQRGEEKSRIRLHVPSLPWTETTEQYLTCAYTQKVVKFCTMMESLDYEVILYAGEENEAPCSKHVVAVTRDEQKQWFGEFDANDPWTKVGWQPNDPWWATMNGRVIAAMKETSDKEDIFCAISGWCHEPIAAEFPEMLGVEWGIGYEGVVPRFHWCFESSAWMHYIYGCQAKTTNGQLGINGRWYDTVIPNSFDPADFEFENEAGLYNDEPYLLFIGRLVQRKGPQVAAQIADRLGMKLVVAGPGADEVAPGLIASAEVAITGVNLDWEGPVGVERRSDLMAGATAVIAPTFYLEPFGGVAVEAMMCGTPVVASPWGAFMETVVPDVSGYHFHTLAEGAEAVKKAAALDRAKVREHAERYSIWNVRHEYDRWLRQVHGLWGPGWDA